MKNSSINNKSNSIKEKISDSVIKADCLDFLPSLPDHHFDACITDPPYNISGYDHKKEIGWYKTSPYWKENKGFNKIEEKWDTFSNSSYFEFTVSWLENIKRVVKPNGNIFIFGSYHNIFKIGFILEMLDLRVINSIVWYKRNAFPNITNRMFCESTEYIIWAANNSQKKAKNWTFNYTQAKKMNNGVQMRNMWDIPMTPRGEKSHGKHPSQKPLEVISRLILCGTNPNDSIIDPFSGSGTVPVACKMLKRNFLGIDNNEDYVQLSKNRLNDAKPMSDPNSLFDRSALIVKNTRFYSNGNNSNKSTAQHNLLF